MKRRVVFLHASDLAGGAERSLVEVAAGLQGRGHSVEVWNAGENAVLARWLEEAGVALRGLPAPAYGERDWGGFLRHGLALAGRWLADRPDLVHANNVVATKYAAAIAAAFRLPLVGHLRDEPQLDGLTRRLLGRSRLLLAISRFIAESLGELRGVRVEVLYNAVDVTGVSPPPAPPAGAPIELLTPATYRPNKRIDLVLATAARLRAAGASFRWRVCGPVGDEACHARLHEEHARLGLEGLVELRGPLPPERVYDGAAVVVSTAQREPFGRTVIEAHARALPVVGFASGALPELIENERSGLLVPDGDPEALARALLRLERDRDLAARLGRSGRAAAERRFDLERLLDELEAHHASVL